MVFIGVKLAVVGHLFLNFERSTLNVMGRKFVAKLCKSRPQSSEKLSSPIPVGFCRRAGSLADLSSSAACFGCSENKNQPVCQLSAAPADRPLAGWQLCVHGVN